ncbi:MAG TPA: 4-(cytidine 5'-diphospho)-2-C-methyl-D-erythritol kinase [Bacteroidales bacterium]|nr:4-(cytidine 5'-diphospho)-2-C-methyl-D-erythritol kinase [Bacteroidales bacterium]
MIIFPNSKINIGLNIVEKRPDGFHNIETIFYPIGLSDILEINISKDKMTFENTGLAVENKRLETNLCFKAYQELNKDFSLSPVNIHLHKIVPFGAGLGGGSSDASFTLQAINSLMNLNLDQNILIKYAERVGSDCPFFILNQPAYATEKGNVLKSIQLSLKGYILILIYPGIHVNTAKAYSQIKPVKPERKLSELIKQPIENWKGLINNDFEDSVFKEHPKLKEIKEYLYLKGAVYASMSGSGSSVYGIFKDNIELNGSFNNYFIWKELL